MKDCGRSYAASLAPSLWGSKDLPPAIRLNAHLLELLGNFTKLPSVKAKTAALDVYIENLQPKLNRNEAGAQSQGANCRDCRGGISVALVDER